MTNKVLRQKSNCGMCLSDKSRFLKQRPNKKIGQNTLKLLQSMLTYCYFCHDEKQIKCFNCGCMKLISYKKLIYISSKL